MNNLPDLSILDSLSPEERKLALEILNELSESGESALFNDLKYEDFEEVPVDIMTFISDERYLGRGLYLVDEATGERKCTVFPYWIETLKDIFPDNLTTKYNTIVLTGSIGLGKSFIAVICQLYLLYRMMCLKDPYQHFSMQPIDKITFSMLNVTLEAAQGVAWDKAQNLLQSSEWFMEHGNMNASRTNPQWQPPKGIELIFGSSNRHVVGRALFCLDGETTIVTTEGDKKLVDLVDKDINVISVDAYGNKIISDTCTVKPTVETETEYQIELEDGSLLKCTAEHRLMLKDGSYKAVKDLTIKDELADINRADELTYCVYTHTNLINNKKYVGITCNNVNRRWQNGLGYKNNSYFYDAIKKYGWDKFKHEIITENLSKDAAYKLEQDLIIFYDTANPMFGYNIALGGGGTPKYRTEEERNCAVKAQNHLSYLHKKADEEKYKKHLASSRKARQKINQDPERRKLQLERTAAIKQEVKTIRKQIRQLHKKLPNVLSESDKQTAFGYNDSGSYLCSSKSSLQSILNKLLEATI